MSEMSPAEMRRRTREFALRIIRMAESLPHTRAGNVIAGQLIRCGTSVAANYRSALRGRSYADFVSKIGIVEEEADETLFWIDMAIATELVPQKLTQAILAEADELVAIVTATRKTGQARKRSRNNPKPRQPEAGGPPQQAGET